VEVVRQPIAVRAHSRRSLEEHLVRFPRAVALLARAIWRFYCLLPARSRIRQAIVRRYTQREFEATNRRDREVQLALYHPEGESTFPPELAALGWEPLTRGREARLSVQQRWDAEWGEFRFEPEEVIDFSDDRVMVVGRIKGSGLTSGAAVDHDWAIIFTLSGGRAIREQVFLDRGEAFAAAGLSE
jgi:ketosteroid isomerase-like protein